MFFAHNATSNLRLWVSGPAPRPMGLGGWLQSVKEKGLGWLRSAGLAVEPPTPFPNNPNRAPRKAKPNGSGGLLKIGCWWLVLTIPSRVCHTSNSAEWFSPTVLSWSVWQVQPLKSALMASKPPRRPGDFAQRAKFIGDLATGQITQEEIDALPPMGKEISGQARTQALTPERRREIATKASQARVAKLATQQT